MIFIRFRIISLIKPPKVDADSGVKNDGQNSDLLEQNGDIEDSINKDGTDDANEPQQKKKHKKEKVGFRDRKVFFFNII